MMAGYGEVGEGVWEVMVGAGYVYGGEWVREIGEEVDMTVEGGGDILSPA